MILVLKKRKKFLIIWCICAAVYGVALGTNFGIIKYNKSITVNTSPNIDIHEYLPFDEDAVIPKFKEQVKKPHILENGFVLYYTAGCPYTAKYAPLIEECAKQNGIPLKIIQIDSLEKAKNAPMAWTNYALFYNGEYVTNEILSEKKFLALAESLK